MPSNKPKPLVSIIALCYNQAKYAVETLDSIVNQTYPNIHLIIIDDCSSDNSVEVIKSWIEINKIECEFIIHKKNWGLNPTCNDGLQRVKGDYYQIISCDDILNSYKIEKQIKAFQNLSTDFAVIYSDAELIKSNGVKRYGLFIQNHQNFVDVPSGKIFEELLNKNYIPALSVLVRTSVTKEIGGYDENLSYEDYDLWLRISIKYKFKYLDVISGYYRIHSSNFHANTVFIKDRFWIYYKHIDKYKPLIKKKLIEEIFLAYRHDFSQFKQLIKIYKKHYKDGTLLSLLAFFNIKYSIGRKIIALVN